MPFINRANVTGIAANQSEDFPDEVDDDDVQVVAYLAGIAAIKAAPSPVDALTDLLVAKGTITAQDASALAAQANQAALAKS